MHRPVLAVVLVLGIAGAPEALEACQIVCTPAPQTQTSAPAAHAQHSHSHQRAVAPSGGTVVRQSGVEVCAHLDALLPVTRQPSPITRQPAMGATASATFIVTRTVGAAATALHQKPPGSVPLATQLRV